MTLTAEQRIGKSRILYPEPEGDGYTSQPTHVRVYREDRDDYPWQVDGADDAGNYTEDVRSFTTWGEAIEAIPAFIADQEVMDKGTRVHGAAGVFYADREAAGIVLNRVGLDCVHVQLDDGDKAVVPIKAVTEVEA